MRSLEGVHDYKMGNSLLPFLRSHRCSCSYYASVGEIWMISKELFHLRWNPVYSIKRAYILPWVWNSLNLNPPAHVLIHLQYPNIRFRITPPWKSRRKRTAAHFQHRINRTEARLSLNMHGSLCPFCTHSSAPYPCSQYPPQLPSDRCH